MKFDFDDILIQPAAISRIESRKQVDVFYEDGYLPLFTAPMDTVIDDRNYTLFQSAGIKVVRPRKEPVSEVNLESDFNNFISFGKDEFKKIFLDNGKVEVCERYYVLIDIANGHMQSLLDVTREAKSLYGDDMVLMVGNIANPETYRIFSDAGADFARIGIGNGGGCWLDGTRILTNNGYKNIELVTTSDIVMTHTGEWKPVILTHEIDYFEDLIEINGDVSTRDHKYYVVNIDDKEKITKENYMDYAYWLDAENILPDFHLILEMD